MFFIFSFFFIFFILLFPFLIHFFFFFLLFSSFFFFFFKLGMLQTFFHVFQFFISDIFSFSSFCFMISFFCFFCFQRIFFLSRLGGEYLFGPSLPFFLSSKFFPFFSFFSFFLMKKVSSFLFSCISFNYVLLLALVSEFNFLLRSRCSMEMWCPDDIGRDSWDWVGPPACGRA